jgi:peptidoglycan hydrolase CwlO-like protein
MSLQASPLTHGKMSKDDITKKIDDLESKINRLYDMPNQEETIKNCETILNIYKNELDIRESDAMIAEAMKSPKSIIVGEEASAPMNLLPTRKLY